ncbi:MAG: hypothetical protein AAGF92_15005 [Myxococcota bacterium]
MMDAINIADLSSAEFDVELVRGDGSSSTCLVRIWDTVTGEVHEKPCEISRARAVAEDTITMLRSRRRRGPRLGH